MNGLKEPFHSELMICAICGKKQRANPNKSSQWTTITFDDKMRLYFCPKCWPMFLKTRPDLGYMRD